MINSVHEPPLSCERSRTCTRTLPSEHTRVCYFCSMFDCSIAIQCLTECEKRKLCAGYIVVSFTLNTYIENISIKMDWNKLKVLQLIEEYKKRPILWKPGDINFRNKVKKATTWEEVATIFDTDSITIQKKIHVLLAQFRRERRKIIQNKRLGERRRSTWFAYPSMLFLTKKQVVCTYILFFVDACIVTYYKLLLNGAGHIMSE